MKRTLSTLVALILAACGGAAPPPVSAREAATPPTPQDTGDVEVVRGLLPPMPVAVTSFGAATDGTYVYALGGYHGTPHEYTREGQSRSLWRVRADGSGAWEEVGQMPEGLQGLALVAHEGRLCRFGGNTIDNTAGESARMRSVPDAACWTANGWDPLPPMPIGRSSHEAAVIGDTVYIAGGWRLDGDAATGQWQETVLALDLANDGAAWRSIDAPFTRRAVGVAAAADKLVVIGGLEQDRQVSRRVDVLDPVSGAWTRGPDFPADAFGVAAVGVGESVYASARDGAVYRWRAGSDAWERAGTLAFPRFFHRLVAPSPSTLIALGGIGGMHTEGRTRHVERIDLDADEPGLALFTMRYPGAAKNRQGVFLHGDYLYLFGGNDSLEQHDFEPENFESEGWRLHLPSMRWERVADFPERRQTMQTLVEGDLGIAVGGFGHNGTAAVSHPDVYTFDFASGAFRARAPMPHGRTQFGLAAHDGQLFVIGGLDYDPARSGDAAFDHVTSILAAPIHDPSAPFAPIELALPGPRRAFAGASLGDRYYIVGGMREGFQLVDDCLAIDLEAGRTAPIACPRATRLSAELVALDGRLFLASGSVRAGGEMQADRSIEAYDPATDRWSVVVEELPFETRHARMLAYRDRLLIVSTHRDDGRILIALVDPSGARE